MASEVGVGNVSAALPVAAAEAVGAHREAALLPTPAAALGLPLPSSGVKAEISTAAQLLSTLLNHPALADLDVPPAAPLLKAATPQATAIAEALRSGITLSGLFYESHQAEWIAGTRDIDDLRREPQAKPAADANVTDTTLPALVRQQLDMLDGQPLAWRGELWPGMPLQLSIERHREAGDDRAAAAAAGEVAEESWQGRIVSTLPSLGQVTARLRIAGDRLHLDIGSSDGRTSAAIAAEAATLGRALQAAGLRLESFASNTDEPA